MEGMCDVHMSAPPAGHTKRAQLLISGPLSSYKVKVAVATVRAAAARARAGKTAAAVHRGAGMDRRKLADQLTGDGGVVNGRAGWAGAPHPTQADARWSQGGKRPKASRFARQGQAWQAGVAAGSAQAPRLRARRMPAGGTGRHSGPAGMGIGWKARRVRCMVSAPFDAFECCI